MDTLNPNLLKSVGMIHEVAVAYIFLSCAVPGPALPLLDHGHGYLLAEY
jgi:hypothetical protein